MIKNIFSSALLAGFLLTAGCKKELNTNLSDPNGPGINSLSGKDVFAQALVSSVSNKIGTNLGGTDSYDYATQWMQFWARTTSFAPSGSQEQMETFSLNNSFADPVWVSLYHNIYDYNFVIANSSANSILPGASMVMRAMVFEDLVDQFGNIPYSQACQPAVTITPIYDSATSIYPRIVSQIDSAITSIQASQSTGDDVSDVMFQGSKTLWIEFANTIKLRMLLRQVPNTNNQAYITTEINSILSQGGGFLGSGQDATINPGFSDAQLRQNPFWADYGFLPGTTIATQNNDFFIANTFMLNFLDSTDDPRLGYFYNKNSNEGYGGNYFGSGVNQTANLSSIGTGILQSPSMPALLFSAAQSFFMQAEAVQRGLMQGDYQSLFQQGVEESFRFLGVTGSKAAADAFISGSANQLVNINISANPLETILYQKWVSECELDGYEAYCDYRRTGYPVISTPSFAAPGQPMPKRLLYPESEYTQNSANVNAQNQQATDINTRIFWGM